MPLYTDKMKKILTLAFLASANFFDPAVSAQDRPRCGDYYVRPCTCPRGCSENYCEKLCKLQIDAYPRCGYACSNSDCVCGAYGKKDSVNGLQWAFCNPLVTDALASETIPEPEEKLPDGVEEIKTPHGDFIVTDETVRRGGESESGSGIGVQLGKSPEGMVVKKIVKGGPAEKAGLREGDTITAINLGAAGIGSTKGMSLKDAVQSLRGKPGTLVSLQVRKKKSDKVIQIGILRAADSLSGVVIKGDEKAVRRIPLESFKAKECPRQDGACYLLFPADGDCVYTCPSEK